MIETRLIQYWIDSSDENFKSMINIFNTGEYMWALFVGHLVIEKLLKAYYLKMTGKEIPRTHDLYKLAMKSGLVMTEDHKDALQYITLFNIEVRYENYRQDFFKKCTKEFSEKNIQIIKELRAWLKEKIKN